MLLQVRLADTGVHLSLKLRYRSGMQQMEQRGNPLEQVQVQTKGYVY